MSLKSFDKFCESIIMGEPKSLKEILDERQKLMRSRISVEALLIFGCSAILNCMVMEEIYKWAESQLAAMMLLMTVCLMYWQIRCAAAGCMIGTNGRAGQTFTGVYVIFAGAFIFFTKTVDRVGEPDFIIKNGALSKDFIGAVVVLIYIALGVFTLCVVRREKKRDKETEEKK